jgi:hypothetical protein
MRVSATERCGVRGRRPDRGADHCGPSTRPG